MNLSHGGHLTHGHPLNFSGKYYRIVPYGVRNQNVWYPVTSSILALP